ncbi:MAG: 3-phosphoshikimate 1-carboxyvinyltransferase [Acidimicrobiales bacterium]
MRAVEPIGRPLDARVTVPGSKSLTNRALVCAALAEGVTVVDGALVADDTAAMVEALRRLGAGIAEPASDRLAVTGTGGDLAPGPLGLDLRLSGTAARFLLPVVALGSGRYRLDGRPPLRARPMGPVLAGIEALGARVEPHGPAGHLPVTVVAPGRLDGGPVDVPGDTSSQYVSGLLLAAPYCRGGLRVRVTTPLVGRPFVAMTVAVMAAFGVDVATADDLDRPVFTVPAGRYRPGGYRVEPDASSASYFLAAAAICGGRVTVEALGDGSIQGDSGFADLLAAMGAGVERSAGATTVIGPAHLRGLGDVDLSAMPDMAQTLAAVAVFADRPTRVRGIGFVRGHETDRIAATVRELRRTGVDAREEPDGFVVHPGPPQPARVATYDDHRMAMSFALLGLRVPGIVIEDPDCVAKTFPGYWDTLDRLRPR